MAKFLLPAILILLLAQASAWCGIQHEGKGPCRILLLHGGRIWTASETAAILKSVGAEVELLDSTRLAGLGGASLKLFTTDKDEPAAEDGITPAFERLDEYSLVIVAAMPKEGQRKLFGKERVEKLKVYLAKGGALLLMENAPASLDALLPVSLAGRKDSGENHPSFHRPLNGVFDGAPAKWPCFGEGGSLVLKPGAEALSEDVDVSGKPLGPYIAAMNYGSGKVGFWNDSLSWQKSFRQLRSYAYSGYLLAKLSAHLTGLKLQPEKAVWAGLPAPDAAPADAVRLEIRPPLFSERCAGFPKATSKESSSFFSAQLGNGVELAFDKAKLALSAAYPGIAGCVVNEMSLPDFIVAEGNDLAFDSASAEMTRKDMPKSGGSLRKLSLSGCRFAGSELFENGSVSIFLDLPSQSGASYGVAWRFKPLALSVDGLNYCGYSDSLELKGENLSLESISFSVPVRVGPSLEGHQAWRMACYAQPRGWAEIQFRKETSSTTNTWGLFSDGQPFTWISSRNGVFCEYLDAPALLKSRISHEKGEDFLRVVHNFLLGGAKAPFSTPEIFHFASPNPQSDANPWMGMQQYLRLRYCEQAGMAPPQPLPASSHSNTCDPLQVQASLDAAKSLHFRRHYVNLCPSPYEQMASQGSLAVFEQTKAIGLEPFPWSPCGHAQGVDNEVAIAHPEWLARKKDGTPQMWGALPVFDLNDDAYRSHYMKVADKAIASGMKALWLDMGGAAAETVNYRSSHPAPALAGLVEIIKFYRSKDVAPAIEGQNPLALDGFWYRQRLYANHAGKEFAFTGTQCRTDPPDNFSLDGFRVGMHNAFFYYDVSGYACGMDRFPDECKLIEEAGKLNLIFNEALDAVGRPFVRQTSFGTCWTSPRGAAIFVWNPVASLQLDMPPGWAICGTWAIGGRKPLADGDRVLNSPSKSVILIRKAERAP